MIEGDGTCYYCKYFSRRCGEGIGDCFNSNAHHFKDVICSDHPICDWYVWIDRRVNP